MQSAVSSLGNLVQFGRRTMLLSTEEKQPRGSTFSWNPYLFDTDYAIILDDEKLWIPLFEHGQRFRVLTKYGVGLIDANDVVWPDGLF